MKPIYWILIVFITLASIGLELTSSVHEHWWSKIPGFYIFFGFIGCVLLIFFAKALGKLFIQKDEDYYDG